MINAVFFINHLNVKTSSISAKQKLWVLTDQLPYPPRNGITLPVFNYLMILKEHYAVQLILFVDQAAALTDFDVASNTALFGKVILIQMRRNNAFSRIFGEIFCHEMYQHGWIINALHHIDDLATPTAILVSPMSAVAKWRASTGSSKLLTIPHFAAVNDCTAAEYFYRGQTHVNNRRHQIKGKIDRIRSLFIGRIEAKLLAPYDAIFLQTQRDKELMAKLVDKVVADKVVLAPNGINPGYLLVRPGSRNKLVFVAELSGEYASIAHWLVCEVWPQIATQSCGVELLVIGRGASPQLKALMNKTRGIVHMEYVPDLADIYATAMVGVSPVFKGFGLINKTLEAMACAIPVIGGAAAFNGINGFQDQKHGVVCNALNAAEFVQAIQTLVIDEKKRDEMGLAARALIADQFSWDTTVEIVRTTINSEVSVNA